MCSCKVRVMLVNATFNNISVIVVYQNLLLEETVSTHYIFLPWFYACAWTMHSLFILLFMCWLEGGGGYTVLPQSVLPSVQDIFRRIFLNNCWWQKSDIWSQASYRYPISWKAFLDPPDSYFLFADFVDFYTHLTYICIYIFRSIFLSNYW